VHNNQPGIESHHGGQVVIAGQCRVDRIHRDAHAGLLVVELVYENRDVIAAGGLDLLPPLGPPPPPVLVRLALNRVIRDLNVGLVGGLVLVQVSLAGNVKTMGGGGVRSLGIYVEVFLTNGRWEGICKTSANITVLLCQTLKSYYKTTFYPSLPFFKKNKLQIYC
jgi:hypothetical protein